MYLETSNKFNAAIRKDGRTFRARLTCGEECIESGFTSIGIYGGSNNADTITIGSTISQRIEVEMQETDIVLSGKEWLLEIGLLVNGIMPSDEIYPADDWYVEETPQYLKESEVEFFEYAPVGYFTCERPSTDNGKMTFKAYDRMIKLSVEYICLLDEITTLTVLKNISQITGVPIDVSGLEEIPIPEPVGYTCREVLMYIAQLYGKFANVSRKGAIEFHWWTEVENYIITADDTNGFKHDEKEFVLGYVYMANAEGDDVISFTAGDGKQGISVYNPFVADGIVENVFANIGGFTYTASNVSFMKADIRLDPWDVVTVADIKGNTHKVPAMTLEFKYDGGLSATFSAVGHTETQEEIDFKGPMKLLQERMESKVVDTAKRLQSQITQNADSISAEVKRAIDSEVEMAATIKVHADGIKQKVSKGEVVSEINQSAEEVKIKGEKISLEGTVTANENFKILPDGSVQAKNGSFNGTIHSNSGNVGPWIFTDETFMTNDYEFQITKQSDGSWYMNNDKGSLSVNDLYSNARISTDEIICYERLLDYGDFTVYGTKSRLTKTKSYNNRLLYCYEMPSPIFGDVGHGVIGEDGLCYVDIDQIFFETVDMNQSYQVFLQSYSEHNVYVKERQQGYFVVKGEPNTEFDWELKAKQLDFPIERLEEKLSEDDYKETDYIALASEYLNEYEQEVLSYE